MAFPSIRISPPVIGASPETAISVEVLPAPLEPMMAVISRGRARRSTPRKAWMWPYSTRKPLTSSMSRLQPGTEVGLDHLRVALDLDGGSLRDLLAEVEHRHHIRDAHD